MKTIARVLLLLCLLAFAASARAAEPPLRVFAAPYPSGDVLSGDTFEVVLSVYSTSPELLSLELDAPTPVGMTLLNTTWSTDTIALNRPVTIWLRYSVEMPNDGHYETLGYTVKDGRGNLAAHWIRVRVGTKTWPAAKGVRNVWLPMAQK